MVHRAHVMTEGDTIRPDVLEELLPDAPGRPLLGRRASHAGGPYAGDAALRLLEARPQAVRSVSAPARSRPLWHEIRSTLPRGPSTPRKGTAMLWTIFVILLILWLLGLVSGYTLSGFIHILLVIAVVVLIINLIQGRRVV